MTEDDVRSFQQRQEQEEQPFIRATLAWIAALRAAVAIDDVAAAMRSGGAHAILDRLRRVPMPAFNFRRPATTEATFAVEQLPDPRQMHLRFNVHDPHFHIAVDQQGARAIREIDDETRLAIQQIISEAYRSGWHPRAFAPLIQEAIGLTRRQTLAVTNLYRFQATKVGEIRAEAFAARYADRLRKVRALTIARTETIAAANLGRIAGFEQAAQHGLFDRSRAYLEWNAIQTDPTEICFQRNGTRVPLGSSWDGELPPAHPNCRCVVDLVIE